MSVKQFNLPDPGEGLLEAEIVAWKVKVGDAVKVNDIIVEIETAKSLVELPVPYAGTVTALLVPEGETVPVGTPIISVDDGLGGDVAPVAAAPASTSDDDEVIEAGKLGGVAPGGRVAVLVGYGPRVTEAKRRPRKGQDAQVAAAAPVAQAPVAQPQVSAPPAPAPSTVVAELMTAQPASLLGAGGGKALAKPPVRKLAKDLGIDLSQVAGSGEGGIVSRADVEAHAAGISLATATGEGSTSAGSSTYVAPAFTATGEREVRIPIKGVRKMTAQAMVSSAFTAPHVTEFITVDVTRMMKLVDRLRADRDFKDVKVSPLLVVAKALIIASRRHPGINATWDEAAQEIVVKNYVNLGIAAATPRGLMVPNIKDADQMSLRQLADAMANLISTARDGKTQPAEMSGGSITITNVGVFGVDTGTPILNSGEAAILCFGTIRQMPWVVKGKIKARWVTQLGLSFDHRLVNGDLGSRFLADIAAILHDPGQALVWG
ncbi:MAG: 2-oxo acid dehydrogenase subunit E2 [Phycicoccus sp.]|nr:2-oxo acid dehydrogenase subunit E2 [Phycicoccus sp.]NMM34018.1 2-oxo acid dehydrogenase subunit E2 [Phycicoccus sp.]